MALVRAGLVRGAVHFIDPLHLTQQLLYAVFLPSLIFAAALQLDLHEFWQNKLAIHILAVPGVAVVVLLADERAPACNRSHRPIRRAVTKSSV